MSEIIEGGSAVLGRRARSYHLDVFRRRATVRRFVSDLNDTWGYGGSAPDKNAASPALIDLEALGVDRTLWLPGVGGNYVSTPDLNEIDYDSSTFENGTGTWIVYVASSVATTTVRAFAGTQALRVTSDGTSTTPRARTSIAPIPAGQTYTTSVFMHIPAGYVGLLGVKYTLGVTENATGPAVTTSVTGAWVRITLAFTIPTGSDGCFVTPGLQKVGGGFVESGIFVDVDSVQLEKGSVASAYTLPHRITGDIDLRAHVALEDWTPAVRQMVVVRSDSYHLAVETSGSLTAWFYAGGAFDPATSTAAIPGVVDGQKKWVRATRTSAGSVRFYASDDGVAWTEVGVAVAKGSAPLGTLLRDLEIGGRSRGSADQAKGKVLSAEVRAGIDGVVVARYDANAHTDATYTDTTGKVWTVSRSGRAVAEIVDRSTWAFTGVEYLRVPNRAGINFGDVATADVTYAVGFRTVGSDNAGRIIEKGRYNNAGAIGMYVAGEALGGFVRGVTHSGALAFSDFVWHSGSYVVSGGQHSVAVDGVARPSKAHLQSGADTSSLMSIGADNAGSTPYRGLISWVAVFRRTLTEMEHALLAAWDGSVSTEPAFLRAAAALYINADDPQQRLRYRAHNRVINLVDRSVA